MDHQFRSNYVNFSSARPPPLVSSNSSAPQHLQPPFSAPFPVNVSTPPFMVLHPPPNSSVPPPLPSGQFTSPPVPTGFPPPMALLPPTNVPPPINIRPPTNIPPPCFTPSIANAAPPMLPNFGVPPYHVTNQPRFLANTTITPPVLQYPPPSLPPPPLRMDVPPQTVTHANIPLRGPQLPATGVDLRPLAPVTEPSRSVPNLPLQENEPENEDELWLKNWLLQRHLKKPTKEMKNEMTVGSARLLLRDALDALSDLKASLGYLRNSTNADDDMWQFKIRKAVKAKEKLNSLLSQFSAETLRTLRRRVKRIQAKRDRIRRQRLQAIENERSEEEHRESLHAGIDSWRNEIQDKVTNEKKKEELKNEADNILSEVRKKVQEAKKVLDHLEVLKKLRVVRLENADKKGLKVSSTSTEQFEATVERLKKLMEHQLSVYEAEEHALKVMLETEREQEKHDQRQQKVDVFRLCQQDTLQRLFAKPPDPSSPLFFYWQYYMQGHSDLDTLVQIRHQWDMFLVPQDNPQGAPIPLGWVLPRQPSSSKWEAALQSGDSKSD